jgi:hypothetical protein
MESTTEFKLGYSELFSPHESSEESEQYRGLAMYVLRCCHIEKCEWLRIIFAVIFHFKGLSHEIDFKNFDQTLKNLT